VITILHRNGPPEAMTCPAVICDHCGDPIHNDGNALWLTDQDDGRTFRITTAFVHKACDRAFEATHPDGHWSCRELGEFLQQLAHNFEHPFEREPGVEYAAPAPSTWRLGHRAKASPDR
jgi:hypothetical protein